MASWLQIGTTAPHSIWYLGILMHWKVDDHLEANQGTLAKVLAFEFLRIPNHFNSIVLNVKVAKSRMFESMAAEYNSTALHYTMLSVFGGSC